MLACGPQRPPWKWDCYLLAVSSPTTMLSSELIDEVPGSTLVAVWVLAGGREKQRTGRGVSSVGHRPCTDAVAGLAAAQQPLVGRVRVTAGEPAGFVGESNLCFRTISEAGLWQVETLPPPLASLLFEAGLVIPVLRTRVPAELTFS